MKTGWAVSTLGETCEMYQPKTITAKEMMLDGPYPVFGANGVIGRYDQFNHEEPQLLITCRGATCGTVNVSEPKSWITGNAMVVRPKNANFDLRFLEYLFRGGMDISTAITGAAQPQITRTNLNPIEIRYPLDPKEQQRIVTLLDEAFDGIATAKANAEKNLQNARGIFESYLQSIFSQRGDGWLEKQLGEVAELVDSLHKTPNYVEAGFPMVRVTDVKPGMLSLHKTRKVDEATFNEFSKRHTPAIGDIVFSRVGSYGVSSFVATNDPFCLGQNTVFIVPAINAKFLYLFLSSHSAKQQIDEFVDGTTQPTISLKSIRQIRIPIPPLSDQQLLVEKIQSLLNETQHLESIYQQKLTTLDELQKSLLHRAFSGEL